MRKLILFISLLYPIFGYTQPTLPLANDEAKTLSLAKGVDLDIPKGFHAINTVTFWQSPTFSEDELGIVRIMETNFASADSSCIIAFPEVTSYDSTRNKGKEFFMDVFNSTYKPSRATKANEYIAKHGKIDYIQSDSISFDVLVDQYSNVAKAPVTNTYLKNAIKRNAEKITLLIGEKDLMNADTIAYTALNSSKPYHVFIDKDLINICYPFCTYIVAMKKGYAPVEIFIYMNDKSIKQKDDYIKTALRCIRLCE